MTACSVVILGSRNSLTSRRCRCESCRVYRYMTEDVLVFYLFSSRTKRGLKSTRIGREEFQLTVVANGRRF